MRHTERLDFFIGTEVIFDGFLTLTYGSSLGKNNKQIIYKKVIIEI